MFGPILDMLMLLKSSGSSGHGRGLDGVETGWLFTVKASTVLCLFYPDTALNDTAYEVRSTL